MKLQEYVQLAIEKGAKCWDCGGPVTGADVRYYDHEEGWEVEGSLAKLWLYFKCRKCHYETSFAKLRIERPLPQRA